MLQKILAITVALPLLFGLSYMGFALLKHSVKAICFNKQYREACLCFCYSSFFFSLVTTYLVWALDLWPR